MIYFHYCKKFEQHAAKEDSSVKEAIRGKLSEFVNRNSLRGINSIDSYKEQIYVLRTNNPYIRTIIQFKKVQVSSKKNIDVYFVRDFIASRIDYTWVKVQGGIVDGKWLTYNPLSEEDVDNFKQDYSNRQTTNADILKSISSELTNWLSGFNETLRSDFEIFEASSWVQFAMSNSPIDGMNEKTIYNIIIKNILENDISSRVIRAGNDFNILLAEMYECNIIYSQHNIDNKNIILLYHGAHAKTQSEHYKKIIEVIQTEDIIPAENTLEAISRVAYRAYPQWVLRDEKLWSDIQINSESSNLSLMPEQISYLSNFKFPAYINGQAGSAKSTMLYYLFANICYRKYMGEIQGDILFLTENENLLKHTQKSVLNILRYNPLFGLTETDIATIKNSFFSFKDFLLSQLFEEDKELFEEDKYLHFPIFKDLYNNKSKLPKPFLSKYSAEEVWFAITTYIYGYQEDKLLNVNDYNEVIPRDFRRLDNERLKEIFEKALPYYEKLIAVGYWDKIKIIKHLNQYTVLPKFSVVFCDEAQDFSRLELKFIVKLSEYSEYSEYDLSNVEQVPILFAGDPNQTVSPTGFRTAQFTAMLYEILQENSYKKQINDSYNPQYNYRSSQRIVDIANFVQYYRKSILNADIEKQQKAKRTDAREDYRNMFFDYTFFKENNDLKEKIKYKIIIIPTDEIGKDAFVKTHQLERYDIRTPAEAKGSDYQQVVLFGFGEYFVNNFGKLDSNNQNFEEYFFFNLLYVAVSRAQNELIIIDSETSEENFWKSLLVFQGKNGEDWVSIKDKDPDKYICFNPGTTTNIIASTFEIGLDNANRDKERGIFTANAPMLEAASATYKKLGRIDEQYECIGLAHAIRGQVDDAISNFEKMPTREKRNEQIIRVAWENQRWNKILTVGEPSNNEQKIKQILSYFMDKKMFSNEISDIEFLYQYKQEVRILLRGAWKPSFIEALNSYATKLLARDRLSHRSLIADFANLIESILSPDDNNIWYIIGRLYYAINEYDNAVATWKKEGFNIESRNYEQDYKDYIRANLIIADRQNDIEKKVIFLGLLADIATEDDRFKNIIKVFKQYQFKNINNENKKYFYAAIYKALLIEEPQNTDIVTTIASNMESTYEADNNLVELRDYYQDVLDLGLLKFSLIQQFCIDRWVRVAAKTGETIASINEQYKKWTEKFKLSYIEYQQNDITNIPKKPNVKLEPNFNFFRSLTIRNFRRFKQLEINNLGQFSIIVGDNNVGKTSLLEAFLISPNIDEYFKRLIYCYIERNNASDKKKIPTTFWKNFIHKSNEGNQNIQFTLREERYLWHFELRHPSVAELQSKFEKLIDTSNFLALIQDNNKVDIINKDIKTILNTYEHEEDLFVPYIPFGKTFGQYLAKVYKEQIDNKKSLRKQFIENMKNFIPKIDRISVDTETGDIDIEEEDNDEVLPLTQYGEGANKLFRILLQITVCKGKVLVIDEFDAGIHYSRFSEFWGAILKTAKENDVQIIATTHNIECIQYFKCILQDDEFEFYRNEARIVTLRELSNGNVKAYVREFEEFEYELDNDLEIRGGDL